jgi:hypothetical protein
MVVTKDEPVDDAFQGLKKRGGPSPPREVAPKLAETVPRLEFDLACLRELTPSEKAPRRRVRSSSVIRVEYGFGDASGKGLGSSITLGEEVVWRSGQWRSGYQDESSNFREFENIVLALEEYYQDHPSKDAEIFMFTDNSTTEGAVHRGTSHSKKLFRLVLRLRKLQMESGWILHIYHVSGTRMIASGIDGLSRADLMTGIMSGASILDYVPLHLLTCLERADAAGDNLLQWLGGWADLNGTKAIWMEPTDWYGPPSRRGGAFIWTPPPPHALRTWLSNVCARSC